MLLLGQFGYHLPPPSCFDFATDLPTIKKLGVNDCKKTFRKDCFLCHKMYSICIVCFFSLQTRAPNHPKIFYVLLDLRTLAIKIQHV